jgi:hypothetical protein
VLTYLLPTTYDFTENDLPVHPCLQLTQVHSALVHCWLNIRCIIAVILQYWLGDACAYRVLLTALGTARCVAGVPPVAVVAARQEGRRHAQVQVTTTLVVAVVGWASPIVLVECGISLREHL